MQDQVIFPRERNRSSGYRRTSGPDGVPPTGASTVYVGHGGFTADEGFHIVDALTAGSSVGNSGPVLLAPGNLDASWKQTELDRTTYYLNQLHPSQVIILGSTGSISQQVEDCFLTV